MGDIEEFPIHVVKIDRDPDKRIDKSRVRSGTSLHPAELKDAGKPIRVVAKITYTRGQPASVVENLKRRTEIHKALHEHAYITKVSMWQ